MDSGDANLCAGCLVLVHEGQADVLVEVAVDDVVGVGVVLRFALGGVGKSAAHTQDKCIGSPVIGTAVVYVLIGF